LGRHGVVIGTRWGRDGVGIGTRSGCVRLGWRWMLLGCGLVGCVCARGVAGIPLGCCWDVIGMSLGCHWDAIGPQLRRNGGVRGMPLGRHGGVMVYGMVYGVRLGLPWDVIGMSGGWSRMRSGHRRGAMGCYRNVIGMLLGRDRVAAGKLLGRVLGVAGTPWDRDFIGMLLGCWSVCCVCVRGVIGMSLGCYWGVSGGVGSCCSGAGGRS